MNTETANMVSNDYKSNLKNLIGTFAIEDMHISDDLMMNLEQLASGKRSCSEIVEELRMKYMQRM